MNDLLTSSGLVVESINPASSIVVRIDSSVDTSNNLDLDVDTARTNAVDWFDNEYVVEAESVYITSSPTGKPIRTPSGTPVTSIPSAAPTNVGLISTIKVSWKYIILALRNR